MNIPNPNYVVHKINSPRSGNNSFENGQPNSKRTFPGTKFHQNGLSSDINHILIKPENCISKSENPRFNIPETSSHRGIAFNIGNLDKCQYDRIDTKPSDKVPERLMPKLRKEIDTESRSKLLTNSSIFNQRYQNVLRFPNYRQRKNRQKTKLAFEGKLRRCGLELNGETTISNLRKILQPIIFQEINSIFDKYIEMYFMKAFNNIRENVNLTSENWSQTLRCSISKSLYKQYCDDANVDPFDETSIKDEDFPYFKALQTINRKDNRQARENSLKSEIDNSTGHTSDTNSQCSHFSNIDDKFETDPDLNIVETSPSEKDVQYPREYLNGNVNHVSLKRNIEQLDQVYNNVTGGSPIINETTCSHRKYSKLICPTQSHIITSPCTSLQSGKSNVFVQLHNSDRPGTAKFEKNSLPFFLLRPQIEQPQIDPGNYLNTQNLMTANSPSDTLFPNNYHCKKL